MKQEVFARAIATETHLPTMRPQIITPLTIAMLLCTTVNQVCFAQSATPGTTIILDPIDVVSSQNTSSTHAAVALMVCASIVRILPELGIDPSLTGLHYGLSAVLWSAAYGVWLAGFLPLLMNPTNEANGCE